MTSLSSHLLHVGSILGWSLLFRKLPYGYISDIHAVASSLSATLSIAQLVAEAWCVAVTVPYMIIDAFLCIKARDWGSSAHHLLTLVLIVTAQRDPVYTELRATSYTLFIEWSTLALNHWQRSRQSATRMKLLLVSYFLNRVVFLLWFLWFKNSPLAVCTWSNDTSDFWWNCWKGVWGARLLHAMLCVWFMKMLKVYKRKFVR